MWPAYKLSYALDKLLEYSPEENGQRIRIEIPPKPRFSATPAEQKEMMRYEIIEFVAEWDGYGKTQKLVWCLAT